MSDNEALHTTALQMSALAEWAADYDAMEIPEPVLRQAALVLCDDLAAIISAHNDSVLAKVSDQLLRDGGKPVATVFRGGRFRTDRYSAALANGAAAPWNELDGGSRRVPCHSGTYALPALLAEAEAEGLSTRETLRCLVVAYEVVTRTALAFAQPSLSLHPHAQFTAVGAAAAIAAARRYGPKQFFNSLTIASTLVTPGPFDHAVRGSLVRNMWVATGSWAGLRAADWAACGISGVPESPRDVFGGVFGSECNPDWLVAGLGTDWQISQSFHKIYPCCQYAHSTIEAITSVVSALPAGVDWGNCERVIVEIHKKGQLLDERHPSTVLAARFSIPHIAAVAAIHGRIDTETLASNSLTDPKVAELRERVMIRAYEPELPPPNDRPARVSLVFRDGKQFQAECLCARGSPGNPLGFETIRQKVAGICQGIYPRMPEVMDQLAVLDEGVLDSAWGEVVTRITEEQAERAPETQIGARA